MAGRRELRVHQVTVGKWRSRFVAARVWTGWHDEDRPGAPASISVEQVEERDRSDVGGHAA